MLSAADLTQLILAAFPDAAVEIQDRTGMQDHYQVLVRSAHFQSVGLMDRHRLVYAAVDPALKDGRLHAIEIKTELPN
ncbi:MAG: BolA/IbaG family iron-sulfur metabolism protein [Cyanobacteria bacterium]|nr:BolA/IbaG family iron-sulfur metabolism protein [Cyanobacteriota bacterium]